MGRILLTHSYYLRFDPKQWQAMMPYPPLGTLYAAGMLQHHGFDVALFDTMFCEQEDEFQSALDRHRPSLVVIYDDDFNYLTKMCLSRMRQAAFRMAAMAKAFGAFVVIHSSDSADHLDEYVTHSADAVIVGEGEWTLVELSQAVLSNQFERLSSIAGVVCKSGTEITHGPKRPVSRTPDELPLPARHLLRLDHYRSAWKKRHGYFSLNVVTTRGCPFHCNWCAKPIYGQTYTSRSPELVVGELREIYRSFRPDHIWFADDIFGLKPGWVRRFREVVEQEAFRLPFKCLSRADLLMQGDTIEDLALAGCETVWLGAESGSQKILDAMEKGTRIEQIEEATKRLKAKKIRVGFFLQLGYPGEGWVELQATIALVRRSLPDEIGISVSYPLPGTPFYERVRSTLSEKQNWVDSDDLDPLFPGQYSAAFYRAAHRYIHKDFQLRRALQFLRQALLLRVLSRSEWRTSLLLPYHAITALFWNITMRIRSQEPARLWPFQRLTMTPSH